MTKPRLAVLMVAISLLLIGGAAAWSALSAQQVASSAAAPQRVTTPRFTALQPAAGGDGAYPNFLWVLDNATGQVVVYRIASVKDETGKHEAWISERLLTEDEFYNLKRQRK